MEKYAVEESLQKTASCAIKNGKKVCPVCETPISDPTAPVLICDKCGTKPFE